MGLFAKLFTAYYGIKTPNECIECNKLKNESFIKTNKNDTQK